MSLSVNHLNKFFGKQKVLDDLSFEVNRGELVGFLGPNGAGKSTALKIATCYLPPTNGSVQVCGYDVLKSPGRVKKVIGYLPENNPLYYEMYVKEYLKFICSLHGIKSRMQKERIGWVIEMTGLKTEQNKLISELSKGYRQRVGLAQSLIHDPQVLILDEPTTGLDPNQIIEIRKLIKEISHEKTVIFSTHIMQEVQAICEKAIIIYQGKIIADDKVKNLQSINNMRSIVVEFAHPVKLEILQQMDGVTGVDTLSENRFRLRTSDKDLRSEISKIALQNDFELIGLSLEESTMEEVFQQLTNANRDAGDPA